MELDDINTEKVMPISAPKINKFKFYQLGPKRHLIQFGQQQSDEIHWKIFGERTRDQLVELRKRIKSQNMPVPFVIQELSTPIPGTILFAGTCVFLDENDMAVFLEKLENYLELLKNNRATTCERDPFDLGV